jgi:hypothetical protein
MKIEVQQRNINNNPRRSVPYDHRRPRQEEKTKIDYLTINPSQPVYPAYPVYPAHAVNPTYAVFSYQPVFPVRQMNIVQPAYYANFAYPVVPSINRVYSGWKYSNPGKIGNVRDIVRDVEESFDNALKLIDSTESYDYEELANFRHLSENGARLW